MKNKKADEQIAPEAVVRLLLVALVAFVLFAACSNFDFSSGEDKYELSFQHFVGGINSMSSSRTLFEDVKIKSGTAIIGFANGADSWKCYNCHDKDSLPTRKFDRPSSPECGASACVCLCKEGLDFEGGKNKVGKCKSLDCKVLEKNIAPKTYVLSETSYWQDGFLFVVGREGLNGLPKYSSEEIDIFADNKNGILTVCDASMKSFNEKKPPYLPDSMCIPVKSS